jgi:para-nitrobenzyl esterase
MSETTQHPVVHLEDGAVGGSLDAYGIAAFRGIPYAAPPFGPNRMRPPQPVQAWQGERDATSFGPTVPKGTYPPQYAILFPEENIPGEDCLNLNVWTPSTAMSTATASALPVLVWIHGGSFMNGSNSVGAYDGATFARDGVVCVAINYRLSADGFLYVNDDTQEANLGLQDQLAALRWVQRNIGKFGGDPARVTVAGESAGAMSITTLLSMPLAEGLFAQAITQSGAAAHTLTKDQGRMVAGYLADALGVEANREAIRNVPLEKLVQAASDLVTEIQTAADPAKWGRLALNLLPFAPTVDGEILPHAPLSALAAGQGGGVPLLTGSNHDEARLFFVAPGVIDFIDDSTLTAAASAYGLSADDLALYRASRPDASPGDLLAAVITDWFFAIPCIRVAEAREAAGSASTWVYRFDYPTPRDNHGLGACHAAEIPFVFDTISRDEVHPLIGETPPQVIADNAHRAWVRFITTGDPGWPAYDTATRTTALFTDMITPTADPAPAERALWSAIR